ncbi:MAG: ABC transporter ATP-binding protein [Clostridiales bacterium]|nr:ABC transporter ATP-binding protein [Clostridiales bacterium]
MSFYIIDSLAFSYNKNTSLLKNISFVIEKNQHIGLIGENGCGKTTLIKLMLGILKPQKGTILLEGQNVRDIPLSQIGCKIGYVFQNPEKQLFCPTVWEQMSFSFIYGNEIDNQDMEDRINYYLDLFELEKYKNDSPMKLSRGEKQRLALASVLSRNVDYLIMDEPTIGLDILRKKQLEKCLLTLKSEKKGFMIISHEPNFLEKYVDKLLILSSKGVEVI